MLRRCSSKTKVSKNQPNRRYWCCAAAAAAGCCCCWWLLLLVVAAAAGGCCWLLLLVLLLLLIPNSPETNIFHFVLAADNAPDRTHRRYSLILCCGDVRQKPRFRKTNQIEDIGAVLLLLLVAAAAAAGGCCCCWWLLLAAGLLLLLLIPNSPETNIFHFVLAADNAPDRTHRRYSLILCCGDVRQKPRFRKTNQIEDIGAVLLLLLLAAAAAGGCCCWLLLLLLVAAAGCCCWCCCCC